MTDWIDIGTVNDIPQRGARTVDTALGEVAVFRTAEDDVFALINKCPHKNGPLSEGIVMGRKVACPLHNWVIDLNSGIAEAPDQGCTTPLPLRTENGRLLLGLESARRTAHG